MTASPLLPIRHPNYDFFVCDILDAVPKDDMASMEHPIFSLSTKPDTRVLRYEHNGNSIEITPSVKGLATIHDKDVLIYCVSQLIAKMNRGYPASRTVRLKAYDLLVATNRQTTGRGYALLRAAFERLAGTRITTDITTHGERIVDGFGLIDAYHVKIKDPETERMVEIEVDLSRWVFNAVLGQEVLTINRDYFRLRKPLERRVYEIARKHCGQQREWSISLETLQKKCGSSVDLREFRRMVRELVQHNHLPDYSVQFDGGGDTVIFCNRASSAQSVETYEPASDFPLLHPDTYMKAREVAPGYDVYYLENEWRDFWVQSGKPEFRSPDAAFIGFCTQRSRRNPMQ